MRKYGLLLLLLVSQLKGLPAQGPGIRASDNLPTSPSINESGLTSYINKEKDEQNLSVHVGGLVRLGAAKKDLGAPEYPKDFA